MSRGSDDGSSDGSRAAKRFSLRVPVEFTELGISAPGTTANVSQTGVLIDAPGSMRPIGEDVEIRFFFFPGSSETPFDSVVVRHTSDGFAVQFVNLGFSQLRLLHAALPSGTPSPAEGA